MNTRTSNPAGSVWHRWDPHIHAPGTLLNDQFGTCDTVLSDYLKALNECTPPIRALGITDYYVLDSYEKLKAEVDAGRLPHVDLLFPNIELRFAVNAAKGSPINVHLLVDPSGHDHIEQTKRFLRNLKFEFDGEDYGCTNDELIRLGYAYNSSVTEDHHALRTGVQQSKITPRNLSDAFKGSQWARANILIALPASKNDGAGQLQDDGLRALREQLQRSATLIFSGNPRDREYWLGAGTDDLALLRDKYGAPKPCIHGCDAHEMTKVGKPDADRYCWIRGDVTFDTLRQICFEPARRVCIGQQPPTGGRASNTIKQVAITNATWLKSPIVPINSGLVAIIGARGSGKTALVEMIAAGTKSFDSAHTRRSFLERAKNYLSETLSTITWGNDDKQTAAVHVDELVFDGGSPRIRYLSQQFVDQLCSSDGLADELVHAIEDVIFDAHTPDSRLGAGSFEELRDLKTEAVQRQMERYREQIREISEEMSAQDDLRRTLDDLRKRRDADAATVERLKRDRKALTPTDNQTILNRLEGIREAAETRSRAIAMLERRELKLASLKLEAREFRDTDADTALSQLKFEYAEAALTETQWAVFKLKHSGDVDDLLDKELAATRADIARYRGPGVGEADEVLGDGLITAPPYFSESTVLSELPLSLLLKEQRRLETHIGIDRARRKRYVELSDKIGRSENTLAQREQEIRAAEGANDRLANLVTQRQEAYRNLLQRIGREEKLLAALYKPLQDRLDAQSGTLAKLAFSVNRIVDLDAWSDAGERLFDRARQGPFKGIGTLTEIINEQLREVWNKGSADDIAEAMADFRKQYGADFWKHAFQDVLKSRDARKRWFERVSEWLYSTDHVKVTYGLTYEEVDIQQLSPGTRGIVLLLLYLSIDVDDERPLVIDQPEENLDPKSIFDELIERFKEAKTRRQIIIVTHNANLVVNTDADQVIVAERGAQTPTTLPNISYKSGGLENPDIRMAVCDILEGGEQAFVERAKRLRVVFS
jgi:ABC-type lipoprotein export system ATPase subunit